VKSFLLQSVAEFLKDLPSHDENNFANFHTDNGNRTCVKRPSVYLPTKDYPSEQGKCTRIDYCFMIIYGSSLFYIYSHSYGKDYHLIEVSSSTMG